MDQLRKLLAALDVRQRITILVVAALVVAGMFALTHWHTESDFKPLYTSLSPEDAAAVIQKLKESGTEYRVSESGTAVLAPSARVAELRLELAAAGLPKTGRIGYELFDKTNFGATEFTEHLNYHRALEGELERSISALSVVEQARVHLTFPKDSVFLDSRQPAKASVLLKLHPGSQLAPPNVAAITNLVASAVEGLAPESVSVLDMRGNLLNRPRRDANNPDQPSDASLEYRQKIEADLLSKVNASLEPLLGTEKFRAGVSVDCDFTSGEQSEETLDPTKSVMVTSQKTEEQSGANVASGQPGTASALPRPTSKPGSGGSGLSRKTENISFQSSRVVRHVKLGQGAIKRMSVSVLVDHTVRMQGQGVKAKRVVSPPSPETLKVIREVVSAVTGFSAERGDQLVVEALPFESTLNFEPMTSEAPVKSIDPRIPKWMAPYIQDFSTLLIAGGALILMVLLIGAVLLLLRKKSFLPTMASAIEAGGGHAIPVPAIGRTMSSEQVAAQLDAQQAERRAVENALHQQLEADAISSMRIPVATTKKADVLIKSLRESVAKDAAGTTNVLRTWMTETERTAK